MTIRDTSLLAFEQIKARLEPDEQAVFEILLEIGPAHDRRILEALNQKEATTLKPKRERRKWEINSVTGRRNHLVTLDVVRDLGPYKGKWNGKNKTYHFWRVRGESREPMGWVKVEEERRPRIFLSPAPASCDTSRGGGEDKRGGRETSDERNPIGKSGWQSTERAQKGQKQKTNRAIYICVWLRKKWIYR